LRIGAANLVMNSPRSSVMFAIATPGAPTWKPTLGLTVITKSTRSAAVTFGSARPTSGLIVLKSTVISVRRTAPPIRFGRTMSRNEPDTISASVSLPSPFGSAMSTVPVRKSLLSSSVFGFVTAPQLTSMVASPSRSTPSCSLSARKSRRPFTFARVAVPAPQLTAENATEIPSWSSGVSFVTK
jgi:hypothetical protein